MITFDAIPQLWKSDGSGANLALVKEIAANRLTNVNGTLFFEGYDPTTGHELWKSDGTGPGTVLVKDIVPGSDDSNLESLTNVNGTLFFRACEPATGCELWKSNGTEAGTVLVKDINPGVDGSLGSPPNWLTEVNGTLFFPAYSPSTGTGIWKSDGTEAGTVLVKVIGPGTVIEMLTNVNGTLFFRAYEGPPNYFRLWKSDGTAFGTVPIKSIEARNLTDVNGTLFFEGCDSSSGCELWKSNGTAAGTVLVKNILSGSEGSDPVLLTNVNGTLFFSVSLPAIGNQLWKSDGTAAGTVLVKDFGSGGLSWLTNVNGTLFFRATEPATASQVWQSDGTPAGTVIPAVINARELTPPEYLTNVNGTLFFRAWEPQTGWELWKSNGTDFGTQLLADINPGPGDVNPTPYRLLTAVNGTVFFRACDPTNGCELWTSDGTDTLLVKDINPGSDGSYPGQLTNLNGTLFFEACTPTTGCELWKISPAGPVLLKDINPGTESSNPTGLTNVNGTLFFGACTSTSCGLWKSNGTATGTVMIKDVSVNGGILNANGTLFFLGCETSTGCELWRSNGTAAGTVLVKDIVAGSSGSDPGGQYGLTNVNGTVFFSAYQPATGYELWKSDGTAAGTVLVKDIKPGSDGSYPNQLTNVNGTVLFQACDNSTGCELWKSDGTAAGTVLVKDINPTGDSNPSWLTNVNGTVFFGASDGATPGLWKSDGTAAGTTLVADIGPLWITNVNGMLFFSAFTPDTGGALWSVGTIFTDSVGPGATLTTDPGGNGATASEPLQASVTTPTGGDITIVLAPATAPPAGFALLGRRAEITALPATAADPLVLVFRLDSSAIPTGQNETTITIFKDGVAVPACTGSNGVASPDPCIASRTRLGDGDVQLTVLSSTASMWGLGTPVQTVLGKSFVVKDPMPGTNPSLRSVVVIGQEAASNDTVVGNPLANGATVEIIANGASSTAQTFTLPAGSGWKAHGNPVIGYSYTDPLGMNGAVKSALIKKSAAGTFSIKVKVNGALGPVAVLPPAAGSDGGMRFTITGGHAYCVAFGGNAAGAVKNAPNKGVPNKIFEIVTTRITPTMKAGCPSAP